MNFTASLRRLGTVTLASAGSLLVLAGVDRASPRASLRADSPGVTWIFRSFGPLDPVSSSRQGGANSQIVLDGLWSSAPVLVRVEAASREPRKFESFANGVPVATGQVGPSLQGLTFQTESSADGRVRLRFNAAGRPFRIASVEVRQQGPARLPLRRWIQYALAGGLVMLLAQIATARVWMQWASLGLALTVFSGGIALFRCQMLPVLPYGLALLGAPTGWFAMCRIAERVLGMPRVAARWVFLLLLVRLGFILNPSFESIDIAFHVHNTWKFREGVVISSRAPGLEEPLPVPYPPMLYALLAPFATHDSKSDDFLLRLAMGLMEGLSPVLLFALMRAGGASHETAGAAAATASLMPETLLVLAKGVAANMMGSVAMLLVFMALLRRAPSAIVIGLLSISLLSHLGVALSLVPTLLLWWGVELSRRQMSPRAAAWNVSSLGLAAGIAWLVYYREVQPLFTGAVAAVGGGLMATPADMIQFHGVQLGKILQNLLLKFGGVPLFFAVIGLRAKATPARLRRLLAAWLLAGAFQAVLAVFTPITLRFEYFLVPAVAAAAGLGIEELSRRSWRNGVTAALSLLFLGQLAVGFLVLAGRFEMISVILESNRWPFPVIF